MIVYHGSSLEIKEPAILYSKAFLDFGKGFYVTTFQAQAEKWALRKAIRQGSAAIVNIYDLKENLEGYKVLSFGGGSNEHTVNINGVVWANYSGSNQQRVDGMNYTLTDVQWDAFFSGSTLTSTGSYDEIQEASLLYIKANVPVMFGLSSSNWNYSE